MGDAGHVRRVEVTVPAGDRVGYEPDLWRGALVLIERGEIDVCCAHGGARRFGAGATLFFDGLGVVALRNPGLVDALLVALTRQ